MASGAPPQPTAGSTTPAPASSARPRRPLHIRIMVGLVIGATVGLVINAAYPPVDGKTSQPQVRWAIENLAAPVGQVFLRLIFMVVLPLVFCALTLGIAEIGDVRRLGRIGWRTIKYTLILSAASVLIGVALANLVNPGGHLTPEQQTGLRTKYAAAADQRVAQAARTKPFVEVILDIIPKNPLQDMVGALDGSSPGGMLAVMFFAVMFGIALQLSPERAGPVIAVLQGVYDAMLTLVALALRLAPYGVACLICSMASVLGLDLLKTLAWYVLTVLGGLLLHMVVVYSGVLVLLARRRPGEFFRKVSEVMVTAFATSSSNATLPLSMRVTEEKLGVSRRVSNFVLTVGSTTNQNGSALYEGITVLFLAQVFGIHLGLTQQVEVVLLAILAGVGTAGVPGGSLPTVVLLLQRVGIPAEGIAIILGVDRLLDMSRTVVNVVGDMTVALCVDRGERENGESTSQRGVEL